MVVIVVASILACGISLIVQGKATFTPGKTMGHVWDGISRNTTTRCRSGGAGCSSSPSSSPRLSGLYPGWVTSGMLGWTSVGQHKAEVEKMDATVKPLFDKFMAMDLKAVAADKAGMEMGKRLYLTYCMQCHGADARGAKGFLNLTDADWQYGGEPEQIKETIANGRWVSCRRMSSWARYHQGSGELRPFPVRPAERCDPYRQGKGSLWFCRLCRLSRHGRQGHAGRWRAEPDRQGLAVWFLGSHHLRDHRQGPSEPDAGVEGIPRRRQGSSAVCLCAQL